MPEMALLLECVRNGDAEARDVLRSMAYQELQEMTRVAMKEAPSLAPLSPRMLLRDIWSRLVGDTVGADQHRHFLVAAAQAMRRVLVEGVRLRGRRRDPNLAPLYLSDDDSEAPVGVSVDVQVLERTLESFESFQPRLARMLELRFFAGLDIRETAAVLGVAPATIRRDWAYARGWLRERVAH
ncbi:ECF-type sigma factor [Myxococcus sp. K15C18031901]|uniref:ECF-type sigma factor n=1 Tax=Myxococcus dinghuensis TaxID=2906761 RepID=UPI0020A6E2E8|nr:ECF-type sigma factor [Myxococcus dinghuensis]MCP3099981.1 ECF-type sigma factor [Myxococcus dinghuensis]